MMFKMVDVISRDIPVPPLKIFGNTPYPDQMTSYTRPCGMRNYNMYYVSYCMNAPTGYKYLLETLLTLVI